MTKPVLSAAPREIPAAELPDGWIIIHLGMSGSLRILTEELPGGKHDHVGSGMSNGKVLRYTDLRRFGAWLWTKRAGRTQQSWRISTRSRFQRRLTQIISKEARKRNPD